MGIQNLRETLESRQIGIYFGFVVMAAIAAMQFATVAELHGRNNPPKKFGYVDNGPHRTDGGDLVLISAAMLVRDFSHAIARFMRAAQADNELKARIDSRVVELLNTTPISVAE